MISFDDLEMFTENPKIKAQQRQVDNASKCILVLGFTLCFSSVIIPLISYFLYA